VDLYGTAVTVLYLNSFVGVIQAFSKLSFLHSLAPTQLETAISDCADYRPGGLRCAGCNGSEQVSPEGRDKDVGTTMSP
jgi:hypothetical protein